MRTVDAPGAQLPFQVALDVKVGFVVVGGLPGAGKSTAIRALRMDLPGLRVLDPEQVTTWLQARGGSRVPYRALRILTHTIHAVRIVLAVLLGPGRGPVVVHETATRRRRTAALGLLAARRGWRPCLLVLEVDPGSALAGQRLRERVIGARAFANHCRRWNELHARAATAPGWTGSAWSQVVFTPRVEAGRTLRGLLAIDACIALSVDETSLLSSA